ncbi:magnesium protoporphyrin IX methyltransferase [Sphingomonas sp.]|uniref:magnesium protoporphyrin IX methyltransferase n=1 Tax=Sphingomonas sp. TaxID=28214 RepID=UPI001E0A12E6|nr:magnesium protoporphyrin IX methyltransferase [Sphingomonas sp.]MBX9796834.1 magnesium protoporphyrin IX methyltransferase [Sphingomonas sp.]
MVSTTYSQHRGRLETYFDKTAAKTWETLTSDAPVSGIRATVRAGRDAMRDTLLSWLPQDMHGMRLLDAGCGTGALAVAAAERGADVVAVDVAGSLVDIARRRAPEGLAIDWRVGDMLSHELGRFDHVVAMDSLIHYPARDIVRVVELLAARTERSIAFTIAPRTPALSAMHAIGGLFPRADRAPAIAPVSPAKLERMLGDSLPGGHVGRRARISKGFYISQAVEVLP